LNKKTGFWQMTVHIRVSKSWANFHFWVNYPFKLPHSRQ